MCDRHLQELQGRARLIALLEAVVCVGIKYIYVNVCSAVVDCVGSSVFAYSWNIGMSSACKASDASVSSRFDFHRLVNMNIKMSKRPC